MGLQLIVSVFLLGIFNFSFGHRFYLLFKSNRLLP
nr:MAG TPA: hypothetical protein [Caudoviricetes sp.]